MDIQLKCECGQVQGLLLIKSFSEGNNITCMCDDCQCFAHYLNNAEKILNKNGGTAIFQITPNKVKVVRGQDKLSCVRLTPKGAKRWFTTCCKTPVANTVGAKIAFLGLFHHFIDFNSMENEQVKLFKSFQYHCMGKFGKGKLPENATDKFPVKLTLKIIMTLILGGIFKKYQPNSFFNIDTGGPISPFRIVSKEERERLQKMI